MKGVRYYRLWIIYFVLTFGSSTATDIAEQVKQGLEEMKSERWQEASEIHQKLIDRFGKDSPNQLFGPKFGIIYYRQGLCEMKLQKFEQALRSFEICQQNYQLNPNSVKTDTFRYLAGLKSIECAMQMKLWQKALQNIERFQIEADEAKKVELSSVLEAQRATCFFRLGQLESGWKYVDISIKQQVARKSDDTSLLGAFDAVSNVAIETKNGVLITDFISKVFQQDPWKSRPNVLMLRHWLRTASFCVELDELLAAAEASLALVPESFETENDDIQGTRLEVLARCHEAKHDFSAAERTYVELQRRFPKSERKEWREYRKICVSDRLKKPITEEVGNFVTNFPESKYITALQLKSLSAKFAEKKYDECIEMARDLLQTQGLSEPAKVHYVMAFSLFQKEKWAESQQAFAALRELEPKDENYAVPGAYYSALIDAKLNKTDEAISALEALCATESKSEFVSLAREQLVLLYFKQKKFEQANECIEELSATTEDPHQAARLSFLEVQSHIAQSQKVAAISLLEQLTESPFGDVQAKAYFHLVELTRKSRHEKAAEFMDHFWKHEQATQIQKLSLIKSQPKGDKVIPIPEFAYDGLLANLLQQGNITELELFLRAAYDRRIVADDMRVKFMKLSENKSQAQQAQLRGALLRANVKAQISRKAMVYDLVKNFPIDTLTHSLAYDVARALFDEKDSSIARKYFSFAAQSPNPKLALDARFGEIESLLDSTHAEDVAQGMKLLSDWLKDPLAKHIDRATYLLIQAHGQQKHWKDVIELSQPYLNGARKGARRYREDVSFLLGMAYEEQGLHEDALAMYLKTWSVHPGRIKSSAPAMLRWAELSWARNRPAKKEAQESSDREAVVHFLKQYLESTSKLQSQMSPSEIAGWKSLESKWISYSKHAKVAD